MNEIEKIQEPDSFHSQMIATREVCDQHRLPRRQHFQ